MQFSGLVGGGDGCEDRALSGGLGEDDDALGGGGGVGWQREVNGDGRGDEVAKVADALEGADDSGVAEGAATVFSVADDGGVEWVDEGGVEVCVCVGEGLVGSGCRE